MPEPTLEQLQRWMTIVVQHPEDAEAASHSEEARALIPRGAVVGGEIVRDAANARSFQRLDVYNGGYLARLIEVLESDHDALKYALGEDAWFVVARDYVYAHPSHHPNLNRFGAHLRDFLADRDLPHRDFYVDLARLHWAMVEAFDAPEFEPLDVQPLATLTQEQWAGVVFTPNPSVRLLRFDYPVNGFLQAFYDGKDPERPEAAESFVVAYRKDGRVWRVKLPEPIYHILSALVAGRPFAEALEAGGEHDEDVGGWFQEWSADGLFVTAQV